MARSIVSLVKDAFSLSTLAHNNSAPLAAIAINYLGLVSPQKAQAVGQCWRSWTTLRKLTSTGMLKLTDLIMQYKEEGGALKVFLFTDASSGYTDDELVRRGTERQCDCFAHPFLYKREDDHVGWVSHDHGCWRRYTARTLPLEVLLCRPFERRWSDCMDDERKCIRYGIFEENHQMLSIPHKHVA